MPSDDFDLRLDADGGTVSLPADFNQDHLAAVERAIGPCFAVVDPDEYRCRIGPRVIFKIAKVAKPPGFRRIIRMAAAVATTVVAFKVAGLTWEHMLQVVQGFQEVA